MISIATALSAAWLVRHCIHEMGFRIAAEEMVAEQGKYYVIIRAVPQNNIKLIFLRKIFCNFPICNPAVILPDSRTHRHFNPIPHRRDLPFEKRSVETAEALRLFAKHKMYDKKKLFEYRRVSRVNIYSLDGFEDYYCNLSNLLLLQRLLHQNQVGCTAMRNHIIERAHRERVELPSFNFLVGAREYRGDYRQLGPDDILVIEGIHGLNDKLSYSLPRESKFKIYISALTQINIDEHNRISTTDGRLIRRMVRDARTRGTDAAQTIARWPGSSTRSPLKRAAIS